MFSGKNALISREQSAKAWEAKQSNVVQKKKNWMTQDVVEPLPVCLRGPNRWLPLKLDSTPALKRIANEQAASREWRLSETERMQL